MKQVLFIAGIVIAISTIYLVAAKSMASAQCTPLYGGGVTCPSITIAVNKTVKIPSTEDFVDNLSNPKFAVDTNVTFHLTVTNTGSTNIARVIVKDVFPQFINFVSGPGSFDNATKTLTFEVTSLTVGESRTFTVEGKTVADNQIPSEIGIVCDGRTTNQVTATADTGQSATDVSQICIERKVLGKEVIIVPAKVTQIPVTGSEVLYALVFIPAALIGFMLRRKAIVS